MFGRLTQFNFGHRRGAFAPMPLIPMAVVGYRLRSVVITDAQLQALDVTPITVLPAEPGRILIPISAYLRTNKPGAGSWTLGPVLSIVHEGNATSLMAANLTSFLNTAAPVNTVAPVGSINTASMNLLTFNRIGKALQAKFTSVATKGAGSDATMDVCVAAYSVRLT